MFIKKSNLVMQAIANGVVGLCGGNKVSRYQSSTLVDQLIKCMLAICAWFAPNNGTSAVINCLSGSSDVPEVNINLLQNIL